LTIFDLIEDAYDPLPPPRDLASSEQAILARLRGQLKRKQKVLRMKERYYESRQFTRYMDISVPPMFRAVGVAMGWAGTVIDTYEERIAFNGWYGKNLLGLDEIYEDNSLGVEDSRSNIDALAFGQGFLAVSTGDPDNDEPPILVTAESALRSTMLWNYRTRRPDAAYSQTYDDYNRIVLETLYLPDSTVTLERDPDSTGMVVTDIDDHNIGRVPVVRKTNRDRASNPHGRSDITPPIRYATDAAIRTALGMEIHREFYTTPATFALNVRPEMFGINDQNIALLSPEQKARLGWSIMMGNINLVPPPLNAEDPPPDVKQLPSSSPQPYLDQIAGYANLVSGASGLPKSYLGFATDMSPNADAIRAEEYPMVRRVERRIDNFAQTMKQLAWLCVLWRDGSPPDADAMRAIRCKYADPSVPQRSATADELQKLVAAEVLAPNGQVVYDRLNLTDAEVEQNNADMATFRTQQVAQAKAMAEAVPKPVPGAGGPANPGPVKSNGNSGTPAASKDPANVARGKQIAGQAGQGGS
jgi:Phage portal protein, SPP1 Gp6-like